jgi:Flp pilus assembly protein TadG
LYGYVQSLYVARLAVHPVGGTAEKREMRSTSHPRSGPGAEVVRRRRGDQRGAALVEFALVMPLLAMIVLGTIDLGRVYTLQNRLKNAAQEGAAYAQLFPNQVSNTGACADPDNITYKALQEDSGAASGFTASVTNTDANSVISGCHATTVSPGTHVKVTVQASFAVLTPFLSNLMGSPLNVTGTSEVVVQG